MRNNNGPAPQEARRRAVGSGDKLWSCSPTNVRARRSHRRITERRGWEFAIPGGRIGNHPLDFSGDRVRRNGSQVRQPARQRADLSQYGGEEWCGHCQHVGVRDVAGRRCRRLRTALDCHGYLQGLGGTGKPSSSGDTSSRSSSNTRNPFDIACRDLQQSRLTHAARSRAGAPPASRPRCPPECFAPRPSRSPSARPRCTRTVTAF